jgi:hypothetical protein
LVNVILRPWLTAQVPRRRTGYLLRVTGIIQHEQGVTNLIASRCVVLERRDI